MIPKMEWATVLHRNGELLLIPATIWDGPTGRTEFPDVVELLGNRRDGYGVWVHDRWAVFPTQQMALNFAQLLEAEMTEANSDPSDDDRDEEVAEGED